MHSDAVGITMLIELVCRFPAHVFRTARIHGRYILFCRQL